MTWEIVCKVNEFTDNVQQFSVKDTKVLLTKASDGKFYATSHLCTHYKAPLVKSAHFDDRLTCPWHGACFNVKTGNVEDGPGIDSLLSYPLKVENDSILIDLSAVSQCSPKQVDSLTDTTVVIVGGGPCGLIAAEQLRKQDFTGHIKIIGPTYPIDTPKLSKMGMALPDRSKLQLRDEQHFKDLKIEWIFSTVTKVDKSKVTTADSKSISFDYLVLASGSYARELPFLKNFDNSFSLRNYEDASNINNYCGSGKKEIVVCGSSFIGLECAAALSKNHSITVVGMESVPLEVVLGKEVGKAIQLLHEKNGVKFYLGDTISSVSSDQNKVNTCHLKSGKELKCDLVICGIGAIPNTTYLENNSLFQLNPNKSISTSLYLQTSHKHIFAGGDIAQYDGTRIEHWNVAQNHGRVIANNIMNTINNKPLESFQHTPYFWTQQFGKSIRYCGHAKPTKSLIEGNVLDIISNGSTNDVSDLKFRAFYGDESGQVKAVASLMWDPVVSHSAELLRLKKMPTLKELEKVELLDIGKGMYHLFSKVEY